MKLLWRHAAFLLLVIMSAHDPALSARNEGNDLGDIKIFCNELQDELVRLGFENVLVSPDSVRSIIVSYENRLFRSELVALGTTFRLISEKMNGEGLRIGVIVKRLDHPIFALQVQSEYLNNFLTGAIDANDFHQHLRFLQPAELLNAIGSEADRKSGNPSFRKIDIEFYPIFSTVLGNREDAFKLKLSFDVEASSFLTRGMRVSSSIRIPVMDEINDRFFDKESVRLSSAIFNYVLPLGEQSFLNNNVGYFFAERYGFSSQFVRYLHHGNIGLSARLDFTGFLLYEKKKWVYSDLNLWTYELAAYRQFSKYGLQASISYSKFVLGDKGIRVSLGRHLREFRLLFFVITTDADHWGGVQFRVPLFPQKRFKPRVLRVNIPDTYSVQYDYMSTESGRTFGIGHNLKEFRTELTENYILSHLEELRSSMQKR